MAHASTDQSALAEAQKQRISALRAEAQRLIHEKELHHHGDDGHHVAKILNHVHDHAESEIRHVPHLVFSLTPDQLWILKGSQRYRALKAMFDITHDVIEGEVEHVIRFSVN